jgi:copper chaperone CopZ
MMGQGCEAKVTQALAAVSGVSNPSACAKSGLVKVSYEPGVLKEKQVMAALKKAGLKVQTETLAVNLEGLQSGACSSKVSEALTAIRGVQDQKVCHQGQRAVVTFNPQEVTGHDIVAAIRKTGFKVVL